jgi:DNA-binding XRE family transcriptional regulator
MEYAAILLRNSYTCDILVLMNREQLITHVSNCPVSDSGCIIWDGARSGVGLKYGAVWIRDSLNTPGKCYKVSRIVWEAHNGSIVPGQYVCHKCDNPLCCNIKHLFIGSPKENMIDALAKGRVYHKPSCDNKLYAIRIKHKTSQRDLGKILGVDHTRISMYESGKIVGGPKVLGRWLYNCKKTPPEWLVKFIVGELSCV